MFKHKRAAGGSPLSKRCGLRSSRISRWPTGPSPARRFPFAQPACRVAAGRARLPLSAHCNPQRAFPNGKQPRGFPRRRPVLPSPFSRQGFRASRPAGGPPARTAVSPPPPCPRRAGYAAHGHPACRFIPHAVAIPVPVLPRPWASAGSGSTPACRCRSPRPLNSQQRPPTGRRQPPPGTSSMCPYGGFLGPPSEARVPTRILRHPQSKLEPFKDRPAHRGPRRRPAPWRYQGRPIQRSAKINLTVAPRPGRTPWPAPAPDPAAIRRPPGRWTRQKGARRPPPAFVAPISPPPSRQPAV